MFPGDCVLTTYGVAVVTHLCQNDRDDSLFYARLWRIPGKSIASSSYACLRTDSVSTLLLQQFDFFDAGRMMLSKVWQHALTSIARLLFVLFLL
jgi:hypothetical protein